MIAPRAVWIRDFVLFGGGIGLLAPLVMLLPMGFPALALIVSVGGGILGVPVGAALHGVTVAAGRHVRWLFPLGFPVGALAGATTGWVAGSIIDDGLRIPIALMGGITGGLVLGGVWLPYLALQLRGRSGLLVVVPGVLLSPVAGGIAMITMFQVL
ncbi:MAG: hypothetical protein KC656_31565 [Myxococcales bacterium]|nr:hypothetical protein [Myxococcales bacterium]